MKNDFSVVFIASGLDFFLSRSHLPDEKHKNFLIAASIGNRGSLQIVEFSLPTRDAGKFLSSLAALTYVGLKFHLYSFGCCRYFVSLNSILIKSRSISCCAAWLNFLPWEISTLIELIVRETNFNWNSWLWQWK